MSCRLLRDVAWLEAEEKRCRSNACNAAFLQISRKDLFCGACAGLMVAEHGLCKFCLKDPAPLHRGMSVCTSCVRDPGERPRLLNGLRSGQTKRRKANNHVQGKRPATPEPEVQAI